MNRRYTYPDPDTGRFHQNDWQINCDQTLADMRGVGCFSLSPSYEKALRCALRAACDFDKKYYVIYDTPKNGYRISDKMPTGIFDIVYPEGFIVH